MAVAGIIAEYHPFHRGHAWQIEQVRAHLGADTAVIAAMSGNFVQRGDFAVVSKHARAEMALHGGADLVLELCAPWSSATAERFAQGGVALLMATGVVTHLAFGCESGDLVPLLQTVDSLEDARFPDLLRRFLSEGMSFAAARQTALQTLAGDTAQCLASPNNALAVEYLRALRTLDAPIAPLALPRIGAAHDSTELGQYPSASAIRRVLLDGGDWQSLVSTQTAEILSREIQAGRAPITMQRCERAILSHLRRMDEADFLPFDGGGEGLHHRFYTAVRGACSLDELLTTAKTKRYPMARLRRMLLHSYLGIVPAAQGEVPPYLRVLGANATGRALLKQMKKSASLPIITRGAQVRGMDARVQACFLRESQCTDLYTLAMPNLENATVDSDFSCSAVMTQLDRERSTR